MKATEQTCVTGAQVSTILDIDAVPILDGADECIKLGIMSSLQPSNVRLARGREHLSGTIACKLLNEDDLPRKALK